MTKRRLITLISLVVTVLLVITAVVTFNLWKDNNVTPPMEDSITGQQIDSVLTVDGRPASTIMVTPNTEIWWNTILTTSPFAADLSKLSYPTFSKNATYFASTISGGSNYNDYYQYSLNTIFIVYNSSKDAVTAAAEIPLGTSYFVAGNLLLFPPSAAFSDLDYALNAFTGSKDIINESDLNLKNQALMTINLKAMVENTALHLNPDQTKFLKDFGDLFGLTDSSSWVGTSSDAKTWTGEFKNMKKLPSAEEINTLFESAVKAILNDDTEVRPQDLKDESQYSGFINEHQKSALGAFSIQTNSNSIGTNTLDSAYPGEALPPLPTSEGVYRITINPNSFIAYMQDREMTYPFTNVAILTITILDDSGKSTLVFDSLEDVADQMPKGNEPGGFDPNAPQYVSPTPDPTNNTEG